MKNIFLIAFFCLIGIQVSAQSKDKNKKLNIEVQGNCEMCKSRIEKACAKVKGVKYANWDIPSKELTLIFNENKCTVLDIKKAISSVGHDTDSVKTSDEAYNNLPACCKYKDPNSLHLNHDTGH